MDDRTEGSLTLGFVGDVRIQREDPVSILAGVRGILDECDGAFANLEGPLCDRGTPVWKPRPGSAFHRAAPDQVAALVGGGFSVGLANNCMMNYGVDGLMQTLEVLDGAGVAHAGAGRDLEAAHAPAVIERRGVRVGVLSYTSIYVRNAGVWEATKDRPGVATVEVATMYEPGYRYFEHPGVPPLIRTTVLAADAALVRSDIEALRPKVDWLVVSWHWGDSGSEWHPDGTPAPRRHANVLTYQTELGRMAIDSGADLVVGHHPHSLQRVELYKAGVICYSMGNFAVDHMNPYAGRESAILQVSGDRSGITGVAFRPLWIDDASEPIALEAGDARVCDVQTLLTGPQDDGRLGVDPTTGSLRLELPARPAAA